MFFRANNVKYNIRAANFDLMKQILSSIDWVSILSPLDNDAWSVFRSIFQDAIENCIITYAPREKKSLYTNSEVFRLKRNRNKLRKKFLVILSASDLSNKSVINPLNCQICRDSNLLLLGA